MKYVAAFGSFDERVSQRTAAAIVLVCASASTRSHHCEWLAHAAQRWRPAVRTYFGGRDAGSQQSGAS